MQQISINPIIGNIMTTMKLIDTSKVHNQNKITIKEQVAQILNVKPGNFVAFLRSDSGDIILRNLSDVVINEVR